MALTILFYLVRAMESKLNILQCLEAAQLIFSQLTNGHPLKMPFIYVQTLQDQSQHSFFLLLCSMSRQL